MFTRPALFTTLTAVFAVLSSGCGTDFDRYLAADATRAEPRKTSSWDSYGGPGGRKFAAIEPLNKQNVGDLEVAWVYRTDEVDTVFQNTPVLVDGQLVFCSPYNRVIALDPLTGGELWTFDPEINPDLRPANEFNCRSVTPWRTDAAECPSRIFMATNDARLMAIDAATGERCANFGEQGEVALDVGVGDIQWSGEYQVTSPPVIAGQLVIVGSAIGDGGRVTAPSGVVRAYSAATGELVWAFDLAPPDYDHETQPVSSAGYALGTPNVWAPMSVDAERDMVFLPTGNPAPDYFRPDGVNMAHYGAAVVALRASTGEVLWHFNTVIRDFWDFDVPSQPVLADLTIRDREVPALIQATKMGHIFVLHRETGEPLIDVDYQEVPRHGPLAKQLSEVQPFPPPAFQVSPSYEKGESLLGLCDALDAQSVTGPVFTPITEEWTIGLPSNMGAINWGGVAVDEEQGLIVVNTNNVPFRTKLIERAGAADLLSIIRDTSASVEVRRDARAQFDQRYDLPPGAELAPQDGTDYLMSRHPYLDPTLGMPCAGIPLAEIMVIDIGDWVLERVCKDITAWAKDGFEVPSVAVNVSLLQLQKADYVDNFVDIVKSYDLDFQSISVEVTESVMLNESAPVISKIDTLRSMGVEVALDDFGTGYSSLNYLRNLPVDILKIDRGFILDLVDDTKQQGIVSAIVELAKQLGLQIVAEGVEDEEQIQLLRDFECDEAQGYFYSPPLKQGEFRAFCLARGSQLDQSAESA